MVLYLVDYWERRRVGRRIIIPRTWDTMAVWWQRDHPPKTENTLPICRSILLLPSGPPGRFHDQIENTEMWLCPLAQSDLLDCSRVRTLECYAGLSFVREWLNQCKSSYLLAMPDSGRSCGRRPSSMRAPLRAIDCSERGIVSLPSNEQCFTLSYRWNASGADQEHVPVANCSQNSRES